MKTKATVLLLVLSVQAFAGEQAIKALEIEIKKANLSPEESAAAAECIAMHRQTAKGNGVEESYGDAVSNWAHLVIKNCSNDARTHVASVKRQAEERAQYEADLRRQQQQGLALAQAANAANDESRALIQSDRSVTVEYVSWRRCEAQRLLTRASTAIAREKAKAKIAGVMNKLVLNEAAGEVLDWTAQIKRLDSDLKKIHAKPLACDSEDLAPLDNCTAERSEDSVRCRAFWLLHSDYEGDSQ